MLLRRLVLFLEHLEGIFSSCAKLEVELDARVNWCVHAYTHARVRTCMHTHTHTKRTFTLQRHNFVVTYTGTLILTASDNADSNLPPYSKCIQYCLLLCLLVVTPETSGSCLILP